jgi:phosphoserine phosphatase
MSPESVVSRTISQAGAEFVAAIRRLHPRVAAFDADGTLWDLDAGAEFFYWEVRQRLIPDDVARWAVPRYADYNRGLVGEAQMCGEMVTIHAGLETAALERAAEEFVCAHVEPVIFPEMRELTYRLRADGCEIWIISSTNEWVVKTALRRFGIPDDHIRAAAVAIEAGRATDRLLRVPTDEAKAVALQEILADAPDAAFGNGIHDLAMLEMARRAFVVNPNPDLEEIARARGWIVHKPEAASSF